VPTSSESLYSVTDEDLQLYLKHHGSLRDFKDFCYNYKDISLREYLEVMISKVLDSLDGKLEKWKVKESEFKDLLKTLCRNPNMRFPYRMEDIFSDLLWSNLIRMCTESRITFNSKFSESVLRVYCGEPGDSEFLKELINKLTR